jgi:chromosome segregation ATPase
VFYTTTFEKKDNCNVSSIICLPFFHINMTSLISSSHSTSAAIVELETALVDTRRRLDTSQHARQEHIQGMVDELLHVITTQQKDMKRMKTTMAQTNRLVEAQAREIEQLKNASVEAATATEKLLAQHKVVGELHDQISEKQSTEQALTQKYDKLQSDNIELKEKLAQRTRQLHDERDQRITVEAQVKRLEEARKHLLQQQQLDTKQNEADVRDIQAQLDANQKKLQSTDRRNSELSERSVRLEKQVEKLEHDEERSKQQYNDAIAKYKDVKRELFICHAERNAAVVNSHELQQELMTYKSRVQVLLEELQRRRGSTTQSP